jgi:hypothetical protein
MKQKAIEFSPFSYLSLFFNNSLKFDMSNK